MASGASEALLAVLEEARDLGFLGPGPIATHVAHAEAYLAALPDSGRVADLGTGGGVPGLPLACWRPDLEWVLVDAMAKRIAFVERSVQTLNLRATVVHARIEEMGRDAAWRGTFDAVVARSLAAPGVAAEYAAPLLKVGGTAIIAEPPGGDAGRWPDEGLAQLGLRRGAVVVAPGTTLQLLEQSEACPGSFPRRVGGAAKRPLF